MTKAEINAKMSEIRASMEANVLLYNEANQEDKMPEVRRLDALLKEEREEYNKNALTLCQKECLEAENPMLEAITRYSYETLKTKDSKVDDLPVRSIVATRTPIDLLSLDQKAGKGGIGVNPEWKYMIEALTQELTCEASRGATPEDKWADQLLAIETSYYIHQLALKYKEAAECDDKGNQKGSPVSKSKLTQKLTNIMQAMLGPEYHAISRDVNYLLSVFVNGKRIEYDENGRVKKFNMNVSSYKTVTADISDILHTKITGAEYGVTGYKTVKAK